MQGGYETARCCLLQLVLLCNGNALPRGVQAPPPECRSYGGGSAKKLQTNPVIPIFSHQQTGTTFTRHLTASNWRKQSYIAGFAGDEPVSDLADEKLGSIWWPPTGQLYWGLRNNVVGNTSDAILMRTRHCELHSTSHSSHRNLVKGMERNQFMFRYRFSEFCFVLFCFVLFGIGE